MYSKFIIIDIYKQIYNNIYDGTIGKRKKLKIIGGIK